MITKVDNAKDMGKIQRRLICKNLFENIFLFEQYKSKLQNTNIDKTPSEEIPNRSTELDGETKASKITDKRVKK